MFPDFDNTSSFVDEIKAYLRIDMGSLLLDELQVNRIILSYLGFPATRETFRQISQEIEEENDAVRLRPTPRRQTIDMQSAQQADFVEWDDATYFRDQPTISVNGNLEKLRLIEQLVRSEVTHVETQNFNPVHLDPTFKTDFIVHTIGPMHPGIGLSPILNLIPEDEQHEAIMHAMSAFVDELTAIASAGGLIQHAVINREDSAESEETNAVPKKTDIDIDLD